jgi:mono/diheme cytochrome c family protein
VSLIATFVPLAAKRGISGQQVVAGAILGVLFVGWGLYIILSLLRRDPGEPVGAELELAPNRKPYYDDDALEGPKLDRALIVCLGLLMICAIWIPFYWMRESGREVKALNGFNHRAAERGAGLFSSAKLPAIPQSPTSSGIRFGCADCHGSSGQGGSASIVLSDPTVTKGGPPVQVSWSAPPLNTVTYRFTDAELLQIITYGRPGTPMPAWGVAGRGPMSDQQLSDVIAYIHSIQLTPAEAKKFWADKATQTASTEGVTFPNADPLINGRILFDTNCARCHTKGYSYGLPQVAGGGGQYGPNLTNGSERRQFPLESDQVTFVQQGVDPGQGYGTGGIATSFGGGMPHFGGYLTPQEIKEIVDYERSL